MAPLIFDISPSFVSGLKIEKTFITGRIFTLNEICYNKIPRIYLVKAAFFTLIATRISPENLFSRCSIVPIHVNSPLTIIATRLQSALHSSTLCEESKIDFPDLLALDSSFHRFRLQTGSNAMLGSSGGCYLST